MAIVYFEGEFPVVFTDPRGTFKVHTTDAHDLRDGSPAPPHHRFAPRVFMYVEDTARFRTAITEEHKKEIASGRYDDGDGTFENECQYSGSDTHVRDKIRWLAQRAIEFYLENPSLATETLKSAWERQLELRRDEEDEVDE